MKSVLEFLRRLLSWGYAKHIDPPVFACQSRFEAEWSARNYANQRQGHQVWDVLPTGSMVPLLPKAHSFLVSKVIPFAEIRPGIVAVYSAKWSPQTPLVHRLVAKDGLGYIARGDANKRSESWERVVPGNFIGEVVSIYTYPNSL